MFSESMQVFNPPSVDDMEQALARNAVDIKLNCGLLHGFYLFTPLDREYKDGDEIRIWVGTAAKRSDVLRYIPAEFSQNDRTGRYELILYG
jgi:hypothetical protein